MVLWPKPAICGKMNHIQWVHLFPAVSSSTTRAYTEACASTKRTRSGSVARAAWVHGHALISAPIMAKICAYPGRFAFSEAENGQTAAVTLCRFKKSWEADVKRMLFRALFANILLSTIAQPQFLLADPLSPPSGSYELTARLELPHLERWGVDKTAIICLPKSRGPDEIPVPAVSANNPFAKCLRRI